MQCPPFTHVSRSVIKNAFPAPTEEKVLKRISLGNAGLEGNGASFSASISSDNRYVAFASSSNNFVSDDTLSFVDIFVRDLANDTIRRVSVSSLNVQADKSSTTPTISADGRYVSFSSSATSLVLNDNNAKADVFRHDLQTGTTIRITLDPTGGASNGGVTGTNQPALSSDGRFVIYTSDADNLVAGDTNGVRDIFVYDHQSGSTERVSVSSAGVQGDQSATQATITPDGRYVSFISASSTLVSGKTTTIPDVFIRDLQTGTTERVSLSSAGVQGNSSSFVSSLSDDGRYVAFRSNATNLVGSDTNGDYDIFVRDRQTDTTLRVSVDSLENQANGHSYGVSISGDGRYVVFSSDASNLVANDTNSQRDVFVRDLLAGTTRRLSVDKAGMEANGRSDEASIAADGIHVIFSSNASNLVSGDSNGQYDIFISDLRFTPGNDDVTLTGANENVDGLYGDDTITGSAFADIIFGNAGMDILNGGEGADILYGGDGNDTLDGGSTNADEIDVLYGGVGDDTYIVNSTAAKLDIAFEGGDNPGGAGDTDTIISKGEFFWDFYNIGEILTIDASVVSGGTMVSGTGDSIMNGNDAGNILLAYGGFNEINPGKGIDTIGLSLYGLAASFNGSNIVRLKPGDDVNYIYDFESGTDKIDTSAYGRFADGAQTLANVADTGWGSLIWMGEHEGQNEYVGIIGLNKADLAVGDFLA